MQYQSSATATQDGKATQYSSQYQSQHLPSLPAFSVQRGPLATQPQAHQQTQPQSHAQTASPSRPVGSMASTASAPSACASTSTSTLLASASTSSRMTGEELDLIRRGLFYTQLGYEIPQLNGNANVDLKTVNMDGLYVHVSNIYTYTEMGAYVADVRGRCIQKAKLLDQFFSAHGLSTTVADRTVKRLDAEPSPLERAFFVNAGHVRCHLWRAQLLQDLVHVARWQRKLSTLANANGNASANAGATVSAVNVAHMNSNTCGTPSAQPSEQKQQSQENKIAPDVRSSLRALTGNGIAHFGATHEMTALLSDMLADSVLDDESGVLSGDWCSSFVSEMQLSDPADISVNLF